jgi:membrane fusion protein (multidrug efflux system)
MRGAPHGNLIVTTVLVVALTAGLTACEERDEKSAAAAQSPPPAVTIVKAVMQPVGSASIFTGKVQAVDRIDLRARVEGFLEQRAFTEGAEVEKGALLLKIEQGQYKVRVEESTAAVLRAEANLRLAQVELDRSKTLVQQKVAAQSRLDQAQSAYDVAQAELTSARASLEKAKLDLSYTEIMAPVAGRIGRISVSVGNFVGPSNGSLATLVSQDPMYVVFPVTERELLEARKEAAASGRTASSLNVRIRLADDRSYSHSGTIDFVDVQVAGGTDTVTVRAVMPNPERTLIDGQLVTASIEAKDPQNLPVIPQQALQADQQGTFVLVVDGENKVQVRRIQLGPQVEGGRIAAQSGLQDNDRIITEGVQRVRPGQVVAPVEATSGAPPQTRG